MIKNLRRYFGDIFQLDRLFETLLALNWTWHFLLSMLPVDYVSGNVFNVFRAYLPNSIVILLFGTICILHLVALLQNILRLRQALLIANIGILILIASSTVFRLPIAGGAGFIGILIWMSFMTLRRITLSRYRI